MNAGSVTAADVPSPGPQEHAPAFSPFPSLSFPTSWLVKSTSAGGREHVRWGTEGACEERPKESSLPHRSDPAART